MVSNVPPRRGSDVEMQTALADVQFLRGIGRLSTEVAAKLYKCFCHWESSSLKDRRSSWQLLEKARAAT